MKLYYLSNARLPTEKAHGLAVMKTCEALAVAGHDVELIAPRRRNQLTDDPFAYYGIKTRFPLRTLSTIDLPWGRFGFLLQEISFAVAAALFLKGKMGTLYSRDEVVLWAVSFFNRQPIVWESHVGAWNKAARSVARRCRSLVVISHGLKDFYAERGILGEKISVVPSAIDPEQFAHPEDKAVARKRLGLPENARIAMYIGRLDGWKGVDTLLEASSMLHPDIRVVVIGGEHQQIEKLTPQYPHVTFLGFRPYDELPDNQAAADVLVISNTGKDPISARFTSPLKLVAHMASDRPIVASDLPSIREIVGDDGAYMVRPDDPQALAEGIKKVLADGSFGGKLSKCALEKVERYTWKARATMIGKLLAND